MDSRERIDASTIPGNAPQHLKQSLLDLISAEAKLNRARGTRGFEPEIASRIAEEPERLEGRVVGEITVHDDMLNGRGTIHGACSALLIDNCSSMPIALLNLATTGKGDLGVSQSLHILYHAPAVTNDKLRIVSTSITLGSRVLSSRCEIWNVTKHRLVASGVHTKMVASVPNTSSKL
ncbi:HotDog domain-containing protein [Boletus edulis BED1]|uniref:HotDog domain-containing protein n=1 Tax=Boletus edulis BED1 TaxID=1328754 RepID=A0AAD4GCC1_BOLED|nr:HotDog domain-containing protein [Boletus edulis BED1]